MSIDRPFTGYNPDEEILVGSNIQLNFHRNEAGFGLQEKVILSNGIIGFSNLYLQKTARNLRLGYDDSIWMAYLDTQFVSSWGLIDTYLSFSQPNNLENYYYALNKILQGNSLMRLSHLEKSIQIKRHKRLGLFTQIGLPLLTLNNSVVTYDLIKESVNKVDTF